MRIGFTDEFPSVSSREVLGRGEPQNDHGREAGRERERLERLSDESPWRIDEFQFTMARMVQEVDR